VALPAHADPRSTKVAIKFIISSNVFKTIKPKKENIMKLTLSIFAITAVVLLSACSEEATPIANATPEKSKETAAATNTNQEPTLPADFFLAEAPADAPSVSDIREDAKPGTEVVMTGYIGGRMEPFTEGRALFLMADSVMAPACLPENCDTPWDACCIPNDVIAANSASVQVVDEKGKILPLDLNGQNGLKPGSVVTVSGKIREANDAILIVDATGIAVNK
jgi:hypothetical protein